MPTMAPTACTEGTCPNLAVDRGKCAAHLTGSTGRGYDRAHRGARAQLEQTLPAPCAYGCGRMLTRDDPWIAAHVVDGQPRHGWVAGCPSCNMRAKNAAVKPTSNASVVHGDRRGASAVEQRADSGTRERAVPFA